jgi:hypothetical protein
VGEEWGECAGEERDERNIDIYWRLEKALLRRF